MEQKNSLTEGKILSALIKFAIPVLLALFLQSLYGGVDLLIVGQFASTADVSGVATGSMLMQTITMVITGLAMGITIVVGQKIGEEQPEEAGQAIGAGIFLFIVFAVVMTFFMVAFTGQISELLHAPEEAMNQTNLYIRICGVGSAFVVAYNVLGAIFRGIGDSKTPLMTVVIACIFNIVGDLFFVAVLGLGAAGAALATVISQGVSVLISMIVIMKKQLPFEFEKSSIRFDKKLIARELKLGVPIGLQELLVGLSFLIIQTVVNSIGVVESAGVGVGEKLCGFIMLVPSSFMQSMAAFVAQNVGASKHDRAKKALLYGILTSFVVGIVIGSFTFIRGDLLASIFTKEPEVILAAHSYLKAYAVDTLLTAILFCMIGFYNGYGYTMFVMIQGLIGAIAVRVPLVFLFSQLENTSLFKIGLATPCASVVQIILAVGFLMVLKKRKQI